MLFEPQDELEASHVLQSFHPSDFRKGKLHLVTNMRTMVAAQIDAMIPEEFLNFALTLVSTFQAGACPDVWNPEQVLQFKEQTFKS